MGVSILVLRGECGNRCKHVFAVLAVTPGRSSGRPCRDNFLAELAKYALIDALLGRISTVLPVHSDMM